MSLLDDMNAGGGGWRMSGATKWRRLRARKVDDPYSGEQTGEDWLRENLDCPIYKTHIRYSGKVVGSSFECKPIIEYSKTSAAARDYLDFVSEFLSAEKRG